MRSGRWIKHCNEGNGNDGQCCPWRNRPCVWSITCRFPQTAEDRGSAISREMAMAQFKARWLDYTTSPFRKVTGLARPSGTKSISARWRVTGQPGQDRHPGRPRLASSGGRHRVTPCCVAYRGRQRKEAANGRNLHWYPSSYFRVRSRHCSCGCRRGAQRERFSRVMS